MVKPLVFARCNCSMRLDSKPIEPGPRFLLRSHLPSSSFVMIFMRIYMGSRGVTKFLIKLIVKKVPEPVENFMHVTSENSWIAWIRFSRSSGRATDLAEVCGVGRLRKSELDGFFFHLIRFLGVLSCLKSQVAGFIICRFCTSHQHIMVIACLGSFVF